MSEVATNQESIIHLNPWLECLALDGENYRNGSPYPHIVLDNFLEPEAAEKAYAVFPSVQDAGWIHYVHVNERKHGLNKMELLPSFIQALIADLHTPAFINYLERLTGIAGLKADETLEGGGIHQTEPGGYLNVHADFTVHPHKRHWRRRLNVLIYLNKDWKPEYGGNLELWDADVKQCVQQIAPLFNRVVIFNTDEHSFHGVPEPLACPEGMTRKSIALYYFTEEKDAPRKRATNYRARPSDGSRAFLIWLDKRMIATYTWLKGVLGIDDELASTLLNKLRRKKGK